MKSSAMILVLASFVGGVGGTKLFAQDGSDQPPRRESEDPSYEPNRSSTRAKTPKSASADIVAPAISTSTNPPPVLETVYPPGPRVKFILDGKPVYEGEAPVAEPARNTATVVAPYVEPARPSYTARTIEAPELADRRAPAGDPAAAPDAPQKPAPRPIQTQTARVAGRGRSTPQVDITVSVPAATVTTTAPTDPAPYVRTVDVDPNDLTADKPGTLAAQNPNLLEEMILVGEASSRAKKCYALLGRIKTNVETISRCMDRRGKENARLVHTSEELSKDITDMAAIWPRDEEFRNHCATFKRLALLFNDSLNQTPWEWTEVRWGFDAILKNVVGFREHCRNLADSEPKPIAIVDKKTGAITYQDAPDPLMNTVEAKRAAALQATHEEIVKRRKFQEETEAKKESDKDKIKLDLDSK